MASQGDPRVLLAMNVALSFAFSSAVVGGLAFVGLLSFSWSTVGVATAALVLLTHLVVMR